MLLHLRLLLDTRSHVEEGMSAYLLLCGHRRNEISPLYPHLRRLLLHLTSLSFVFLSGEIPRGHHNSAVN